MLAQVTYIQKFNMADSEDEFMPIVVVSALKNNPKHMSAGRRAGVGRCHDFWNSHNRCPANAPRRLTMTGRCKIGRPAGRLSEFPPTFIMLNRS